MRKLLYFMKVLSIFCQNRTKTRVFKSQNSAVLWVFTLFWFINWTFSQFQANWSYSSTSHWKKTQRHFTLRSQKGFISANPLHFSVSGQNHLLGVTHAEYVPILTLLVAVHQSTSAAGLFLQTSDSKIGHIQMYRRESDWTAPGKKKQINTIVFKSSYP